MVKVNQQAVTPFARLAIEDIGSPFYLQNGDHPGMILVSHPLTGSNYNIWQRAMSMALTAKHKLGFVDGTISQPPADDLLFGAWMRCNNMVLSWLLNSVTREIADSLMYLSTAREMWTDLRDRFLQSNAPRIFQIKKLLSALQQGTLDVSAYYTRLHTLWDELRDFQPVSVCTCDSMKEWTAYQTQDCVMNFLMGLNESYSQIRAQILMMDPLPSISKVFSLVVQEERQRSITQGNFSTTGDQHHFVSASSTPGKYSHNSKGGKLDKLICSHCEAPGHTIDRCYKLHGYPPSHPKYKQTQQQGKVNLCHLSSPAPDHLLSPGDTLTAAQCQQLIQFLNAQMLTSSGTTMESQQQ